MRFHVINQGCAANFSEGEQIAGILTQNGFKAVSGEPSDITILNLCTVKGNGTALKAVRNAIKQYPNLPLVITGCVTNDLAKELKNITHPISISSTNDIHEIVPIVQQSLRGVKIEHLKRTKTMKVGIPKRRNNPVVGILAISNGCLDQCTFCSTRLVKGMHYSYPLDDLVAEAQALVKDGCAEIWLTGQDCGCWGFDLGLNISHLAKAILDAIPQDFRLRLGMGNPRHLLPFWEDLADIFADPRVFKFIHLPVQSGCDEVLHAMGRQHSAEDFRMLVKALRSKVEGLTISTDIIVGFPGETPEGFQKTLDLVQEIQPLVCNITRFVVRKGTAAAKFKQSVLLQEKKERSRILSAQFSEQSLKENQSLVGQEFSVLVDQKGKNGDWVARNDSFRPVVLRGDYQLGQRLQIKIIDANAFSLFGTAI